MARFPVEGETFGAYEIVRRIGRGGMGTVFEARQVGLGRSVALKLLSPELADDPSFRARFEREARTIASLDSPHVIQVFDAGELDGVLYIASQLIHGRDLSRLLEESGPLEPRQALRLTAEVASALADAHDAGILHRDVKPANILIRESGQDLFAYLCDFGIAHETDSSLTRTSGVLGTLNYMAPECHEGVSASVVTDVYSLGCVLWAALSGEAPYRRTSEYQVARAHVEAPVPQLGGRSAMDVATNEVLRKAMAKVPEDRYASARDMGRVLVAAAAGEPAATARAGTVLRPHPASADDTRMRVPPHGGPAPSGPRSGSAAQADSTAARRSRIGGVWAWISVAAVILVLAGIGFAATRAGDGDAPSAGQRPGASSASGSATTDSGVRCGDGSTSASAAECRLPAGSDAMRALFPSLDGVCRGVAPNDKTEETEPVFDCNYGDFDVRYSTWNPGKGLRFRLEYLNASYRTPLADGPKAAPNVRIYEDYSDKAPELPYVWALAYTDAPYSVIVKARDPDARKRGIAFVKVSR